jgi:hypothetical protein
MSDDENTGLLQAMIALARTRDEPSRKSMYRALLRATLYVPTEPDPQRADETRFAQDEPLHGRPVYVTFTSLEALQRWQPQGGAHTVMTGRELFPMLAESDLGSCLINPKGDIRGELYRHEVEMLSEAVTTLRAWHDGTAMN